MAGPCADCGRVIDDGIHHGVYTATEIAPHPFRMMAFDPAPAPFFSVIDPRDQRIAALEAAVAKAEGERDEALVTRTVHLHEHNPDVCGPSLAEIAELEAQLAEARREVARFSTLADERHDALSAEKRTNDAMRYQYTACHASHPTARALVEAWGIDQLAQRAKLPYIAAYVRDATAAIADALTAARDAGRREGREEAAQCAREIGIAWHPDSAHRQTANRIADAIRQLPLDDAARGEEPSDG